MESTRLYTEISGIEIKKMENENHLHWTKIFIEVEKGTYPALASAVERPINRTGRSVWDDIYLILDTIT